MMEASSPLASMQASSFNVTCGSQADTLVSFGSGAMLAPHNFNFKDLSMKKSTSDYFSSKPIRGSSPTASLAADLSQNFHIDQSPCLPTPRRCLFATRSNLFPSSNGIPRLTTPPITSSSPGLDSMDISPLPHKLPYGTTVPIYLQSPTPELTPSADSSYMLYSPPVSGSRSEPPAFAFPLEKKRLGPLRPGLSRAKGMSTSSVPQRPSVESRLPAFRFGNGISKQTVSSSSLSLSEAFVDSPPSETTQSRNLPAMAPPRFRPFSSVAPNIRGGCGSPVSNHLRKMSNPLVRPRKLSRRSHSMYENPGEVVLQENVSPQLASIMDVEPHIPQLPHFNSDQVGDLPRITGETMIDVLDGKYSHVHDKVLVIDCRFEYEYNGGHINGAINFNDKEKLAEHLFDSTSPSSTSRSLVIFHCEYSAHRAPTMAKFLRSHDRSVNAERYPALTYPEAYILDGGYSCFFKDYRPRCFPQEYVEMDAAEHSRACEMGMGKVKKQRVKLARAATFAFGQGSSPMNSSPIGPRGLNRHASDTLWSPTAVTRATTREASQSKLEPTTASGDISMCLSDSDMDMDLTADLPTFNQPSFGRASFLEPGRAQTRRMFSSYN